MANKALMNYCDLLVELVQSHIQNVDIVIFEDPIAFECSFDTILTVNHNHVQALVSLFVELSEEGIAVTLTIEDINQSNELILDEIGILQYEILSPEQFTRLLLEFNKEYIYATYED
jgi:peptide subunit release factor RF-3